MISSKYQRLTDLINDPVCGLVMRRDGVNPADLLRQMMTIKPLLLANPDHSLAA